MAIEHNDESNQGYGNYSGAIPYPDSRFAPYASDPDVKSLFTELAGEGLKQVQSLRTLLRDAGKQIAEPCPLSQLRMA